MTPKRKPAPQDEPWEWWLGSPDETEPPPQEGLTRELVEQYLEEARELGVDLQEIRLAAQHEQLRLDGAMFNPKLVAPFITARTSYLNAQDVKRWRKARNVLGQLGAAVAIALNERRADLDTLTTEERAEREVVLDSSARGEIPPEILEAARDAARRWDDKPPRFITEAERRDTPWGRSAAAWELPGGPEAVAELDRLSAKAHKAYEKVLAKKQREPNLRGLEPPGEYIHRRRGLDRYGLTLLDLFLSRMEAEALRQKMRRATKSVPEIVTVPQHLMDNVTAHRETWSEQLDVFTEGQRTGVVAILGDRRAVREALAAQASTMAEPANWDLSTPEWRGLWAIYGILSYEGIREDGSYVRSFVPEDWPAIYAAAGIPVGDDGTLSHFRRTEIQEALRSLCEKQVPVFMVRPREDGTVDMAARSAPILQRTAIWDGKTEAEAERIREQPPEAWKIQPDRWAYSLIPELRHPGAYFREIPSDTPYQLERAAAEVVGQKRGLQAREFNFLMWLYKQRPQVKGGRFFVDVDLKRVASIIPGLRTYLQARQQRRLRENASRMYDIFLRAGILTGYEVDFITSRRALRDRLYLNPERFPQLARRRLEAETVPLALPAGKAPKRRKKGAQA